MLRKLLSVTLRPDTLITLRPCCDVETCENDRLQAVESKKYQQLAYSVVVRRVDANQRDVADARNVDTIAAGALDTQPGDRDVASAGRSEAVADPDSVAPLRACVSRGVHICGSVESAAAEWAHGCGWWRDSQSVLRMRSVGI